MELRHTLRSLTSMPRIFLGGVPKERAGDERLGWRRLGLQLSNELRVYSEAFADGSPIPFTYSADGGSHAPPLRWEGVPAGTRSLALLVEDPDAPTPNPFVHWILYDIPPTVSSLGEELSQGGKQGRNSMLTPGWTGCAPPKGDSSHRYIFQLFALDRELEKGDHIGRTMLLNAMRGHVLACAAVTGTYKR